MPSSSNSLVTTVKEKDIWRLYMAAKCFTF